MSTIISSQISDTEDAKVDLDGEEIELTIDIGMVFLFCFFIINLCGLFYLVK